MTFADDVDIQTRHLHITQRLRQRRDDLGLTQKQVVTRLARCGLQTTNRALSSLEHGTGLDIAKLPELAASLDCTITYLLGLTDDPHSWLPDHELSVPARRDAAHATGPGTAGHRPTGYASTGPGRVTGPTATPAPVAPRDGASLILGADIPERIRR